MMVSFSRSYYRYMGTMQICVARMLQESGIFFAVRAVLITIRAGAEYGAGVLVAMPLRRWVRAGDVCFGRCRW